MSRRLPVYLLVDSSGSMHGEPIHSVNEGLRAMMSALREDAYARETVHLSIITFDREITEIFALTPVAQVQLREIVPPRSGATHMGEALEYVFDRCRKDVRPEEDFKPMLFVMTDGKPSDLQRFGEMAQRITQCGFASIIGCAAGPKAKTPFLQQFADPVVFMESTDSSSYGAFFQWVSASITGRQDSDSDPLPPPPAQINVVV